MEGVFVVIQMLIVIYLLVYEKYIKEDLTELMLCKLALHSVDAAEGNFFSNN